MYFNFIPTLLKAFRDPPIVARQLFYITVFFLFVLRKLHAGVIAKLEFSQWWIQVKRHKRASPSNTMIQGILKCNTRLIMLWVMH